MTGTGRAERLAGRPSAALHVRAGVGGRRPRCRRRRTGGGRRRHSGGRAPAGGLDGVYAAAGTARATRTGGGRGDTDPEAQPCRGRAYHEEQRGALQHSLLLFRAGTSGLGDYATGSSECALGTSSAADELRRVPSHDSLSGEPTPTWVDIAGRPPTVQATSYRSIDPGCSVLPNNTVSRNVRRRRKPRNEKNRPKSHAAPVRRTTCKGR